MAKPEVHTITAAGLTRCVLIVAMALCAATAHAFDSGSTGADGAFAPAVSTELALPPDGVFNFTTVDIPTDVTVTFAKNTTNTPVVILASGDVNIAGVIDLSGGDSTAVGAAGDGVLGDDGLPGPGEPGGYDGGAGSPPVENPTEDVTGAHGKGPGGGGPSYRAFFPSNGRFYCGGGGGAGFGQDGSSVVRVSNGGTAYGSSLLLPLIGGSGGGGGFGGEAFGGSGGGGGGGAILIAASGTVDITGSVLADGGRSGESDGVAAGTTGGGGSGGGIRVVATTISGNGAVSAQGGGAGATSGSDASCYGRYGGANGADGRIRLEAEIMQRTAATDPPSSFGEPGDLFVSGLPTLRISRVAGVDAPLNPTGVADIQLPADIVNPVTVEVEATGIPLGNIVELTLVPQFGDVGTTVTNALSGTVELSSADAQIVLPQGPSTLLASVTYTLVASVANYLERFAGEPVDRMRVESTLGGKTRYVLITKSGREVPIGSAQLAAAGGA